LCLFGPKLREDDEECLPVDEEREVVAILL